MNEFNPADPCYEIIEQQADNNSPYGIVKYKVLLDSKDVICPNEPAQGPIHILTRGKTEALPPRYDVVNGRPSEVSLIVRKWWCRKCRSSFRDPICPYRGKKKTSTAFDDYIAQMILSDISLTQNSIAKVYGISRQIAQKAISGYMNRVVKNLNFAVLECDRFWFILGELGSKVGIIVLGDPSKRQRKILGDMLEDDQIVLLGITKPHTINNLFNEALSLDRNTTAEVICSPGLMIDAIDHLGNATIKEIDEPHPKIIERIRNAIKKMSENGLTFEEIKLRTFFQDEFRRAEVRLQGGGYHLGPLKTYLQDGMQRINFATFAAQPDEESTLHDTHTVGIDERAAIIGVECNNSIEQYYYMASVSKFLERYE